MNRSEEDAVNLVRSWLRNGTTNLSDEVRAGVLGALQGNRQESPAWWRRQPAVVGVAARLATATAGLAVVLVVGAILLPRAGGIGNSRATASPATWVSPFDRALPIGSNVITEVAPLRLTIELPAGWFGGSWRANGWTAGRPGIGGLIWFGTAGPSPCFDAPVADRTTILIGGFASARIEYTPDSPCHPNMVMDVLGLPPGRGPDTHLSVWLLNVDGVPIAMAAATDPSNPAEQEVIRRLVESVQIEAP